MSRPAPGRHDEGELADEVSLLRTALAAEQARNAELQARIAALEQNSAVVTAYLATAPAEVEAVQRRAHVVPAVPD